MVKSMCEEIKLNNNYLNESIHSIYFGGGTPSILNSNEIEKILNTIYIEYTIDKSPEITLECNPDDLNTQRVSEYKKIGVNRLSIGVQSFHDNELKFMNRAHNSKEAIKAVDMAQKNGFNNISIDLIYGLPKQTLGDWQKNLNIIPKLGIQHLSAYSLTVEKKTALYNLIKKQ